MLRLTRLGGEASRLIKEQEATVISKADLPNKVRYDVVDSYSKLMDLVARQ
jgi:hypothetical protein